MWWPVACQQAINESQEQYVRNLEAKSTPVSDMPLHYRLGFEAGYDRGYEHGWEDGLDEEDGA